jgi:hypothetical protein
MNQIQQVNELASLFQRAVVVLYEAGWIDGDCVDHLDSLPPAMKEQVSRECANGVPTRYRYRRVLGQRISLSTGQTRVLVERVHEMRMGGVSGPLVFRQTRATERRLRCATCQRRDLPLDVQTVCPHGGWSVPALNRCSFCGSASRYIESSKDWPSDGKAYAAGLAGLVAACRDWNWPEPYPTVKCDSLPLYYLWSAIERDRRRRIESGQYLI